MVRVVIAGLIAGAALFLWGYLSWMVLPWHERTFRELPDERMLVQALREHLPKTVNKDKEEVPLSGAYRIPSFNESKHRAALAAAKTDEERKQLEETHNVAKEEANDRHREGPNVLIFYRHAGREPMAAETLAAGAGIDMLIGFFAALAVFIALPGRPNFFLRVGIVLAMGFFTVLMTHVTDWNFMYRPDDYTLVMCADNLVGALVVGIVVAMIVRPTKA